MIRLSTPELGAALRGRSITAVSFISLGFATGGTLNVTEAPRDMVIGGVTYGSAGSPGYPDLAALSAPETQNSVDRDHYTIAFADSNGAMRNRFRADGVHGIPVTVQLGLFDENDDFISTELLNVYTGQSASMSWRPSNGAYVLEVGFTGQLTQLDSANTFLTNPDSQSKIDPADTSMNEVHSTTSDDAIRWGRKT